MAETMTVSSSQGHTAEWHDQRLTTPVNADVELSSRNEFWIGDMNSTDADKFNEIFQDSVDDFNAKQTRPSRKMGAESTSQERQKSYYDGVVDGTFCYGKGKQKETPIQEVVLQIGNKDDNGVTDKDFDMEHWKTLKKSGHEKEASEYAISHLNKSENTERTKRILHKAVERIATLDPEHLIVIRATYHGDEPCGSVSERENSVDVKENEVAQKSAEYGKKLVLLDSLIDDVQSYKSPVSVAKNVLEILKESMNEKGKRVTSDMIGVLTRNTDMLNRKYQAKINETRVKREQIQKGTYFDMSDEQDERGDRSL